MRRRWVGLALATITIAVGSHARADDVGCCEAECHFADGSGRVLHSVQRRDLTQSECESQFQGCATTWGGDGCDAIPPGAGVGMRGMMMQEPGEAGE